MITRSSGFMSRKTRLKWRKRLAYLLWFMLSVIAVGALTGCAYILRLPCEITYTCEPSPTPSPTPTPEPIPQPTPTPTPEPVPTPEPEIVCPIGRPQARGPIPHGNNRYDATPAVCRADVTPDCYTGRYCHPVACEGPRDAEKRTYCEEKLMGGKLPQWELRNQTGSIWVSKDSWFGHINGRGTAQLRWCFPNGAACSKWLDISR